MASEFRYRKLKMNGDTAVLALSQSGETADTIAAIREAKRKGALILGVVNVVGSAIAQITDAGVYNHAGPGVRRGLDQDLHLAAGRADPDGPAHRPLPGALLHRRQRA